MEEKEEVKPSICSVCGEPYLWTLKMPLMIEKDGRYYSRKGIDNNENICVDCLIKEANNL